MDTLRGIIEKIGALDIAAMQAAGERLDELTKPRGSLGRLEELACHICGITGRKLPQLQQKVVFTLAADHGVAEEEVSAFPQEVTAQMVRNFLNGGAAVNVLARHAGARVVIADVGVAGSVQGDGLLVRKTAAGTANMVKTRAMSADQAVEALTTGIALFEDEFRRGIDIVAVGEMGIANTTAASALCAVFTGQPVSSVTGYGTGLSEERLRHKIAVIERALELHWPEASDPVDALSKVGGFEIAGMAGIMLAAAARRVPVVLDGFISGAAALVACRLQPLVREYLIASHRSIERGHGVILEYLELQPLVDLRMRLGEGTGACLGMIFAEAATRILAEMATFRSAGIST